MVDRLRATLPNYPVQEYYGDTGDFTQDKAKEWADICGTDHHVCAIADFTNGLNQDPSNLSGLGITTRLDRFLDYYAAAPGDPGRNRPAFDVTASLQVCPANATATMPAAEAGPRFSAPTFAQLAPNRMRLQATGSLTTLSQVVPNPHAEREDPILNFVFNGAHCPVETSGAGTGVATYDFPPVAGNLTMIGRPRLTIPYSAVGEGLQLQARLYDVLPGGAAVLMDRGGVRLVDASGTAVFDLNGNAWLIPGGHHLRLELTQDDAPYVKASTQPSSMTLAAATIDLPVREAVTGEAAVVPPTFPPATLPNTSPSPAPLALAVITGAGMLLLARRTRRRRSRRPAA
jgi:hypothetical protein